MVCVRPQTSSCSSTRKMFGHVRPPRPSFPRWTRSVHDGSGTPRIIRNVRDARCFKPNRRKSERGQATSKKHIRQTKMRTELLLDDEKKTTHIKWRSPYTVREHGQLHNNLDLEEARNIMRWKQLTGHQKPKQNIQDSHDILRDEIEADVRTQTCITTSVLLFEKCVIHEGTGRLMMRM